jgi:hypothetical protein
LILPDITRYFCRRLYRTPFVGFVGGSADLPELHRCRMMSSSSSWKTLSSLQVWAMTLAVLVTSVAVLTEFVAGLTKSFALLTAAVMALVASLAVSTNSDAGREWIIHDTVEMNRDKWSLPKSKILPGPTANPAKI